jgi:ketosteroid isomerase-like protein
MAPEPSTVAHTYFEAWKNHDFAMIRALLADDVVFDGPFARIEGADAYRESLEQFSEVVTEVDIKHVFEDGPDVLTWYELHATEVADPLPVAHWLHVEEGRVTSLRVTFDPRPMLPS